VPASKAFQEESRSRNLSESRSADYAKVVQRDTAKSGRLQRDRPTWYLPTPEKGGERRKYTFTQKSGLLNEVDHVLIWNVSILKKKIQRLSFSFFLFFIRGDAVAAPTITQPEAKPVERQIEARPVDSAQGSMVRCLYLARTYIVSGKSSKTFHVWRSSFSSIFVDFCWRWNGFNSSYVLYEPSSSPISNEINQKVTTHDIGVHKALISGRYPAVRFGRNMAVFINFSSFLLSVHCPLISG